VRIFIYHVIFYAAYTHTHVKSFTATVKNRKLRGAVYTRVRRISDFIVFYVFFVQLPLLNSVGIFGVYATRATSLNLAQSNKPLLDVNPVFSIASSV